MSDLIDRQAAIDALVAETIYTEEELKEYYEANSHRNEWVNGIHEAVEVIKQLPPAHGTNLAEVGTDTISRAKAIEAIDEIESEIAEGFGFEYERWRKYFCDLPPARPEQPEQCPIYGGMCAYPSDQCYDCPRHAGAKMGVTS